MFVSGLDARDLCACTHLLCIAVQVGSRRWLRVLCERQIKLGQATIKTYCHRKKVAEGPGFVAEAEVYTLLQLQLLGTPLIEVPRR